MSIMIAIDIVIDLRSIIINFKLAKKGSKQYRQNFKYLTFESTPKDESNKHTHASMRPM